MDLYEALGVSRSATTEEINIAYRRVAKLNHPDLHPNNPQAVTLFKIAAEAFEVLNDAAKRSQYDVQGYVGRRPKNPPPPPPKPKPKPAPPPPPSREIPETTLERIQCTFFGGETTGRNIMVHLTVDKQHMLHGGKQTVRIKRRRMCNRCTGEGRAPRTCRSCGGWRSENTPWAKDHNRNVAMCLLCDGEGVEKIVCEKCKGEGVAEWSVEHVILTIPPNSKTGEQITVQGEGEGKAQKLPGYLRVVLLEKN